MDMALCSSVPAGAVHVPALQIFHKEKHPCLAVHDHIRSNPMLRHPESIASFSWILLFRKKCSLLHSLCPDNHCFYGDLVLRNQKTCSVQRIFLFYAVHRDLVHHCQPAWFVFNISSRFLKNKFRSHPEINPYTTLKDPVHNSGNYSLPDNTLLISGCPLRSGIIQGALR